MESPDERSRDPLCTLCKRFTDDLIASDFGRRHELPKDGMWTENMTTGKPHSFSQFGPGFIHHKTAKDLENSAQDCDMCRVIWDGHPPEDQPFITHLGLFAVYYSEETEPKRRIAAVSLEDDDRRSGTHFFDISMTRPYEGDVASFCLSDRETRKAPDFARAIPDSSMSTDAFETVRFWIKDCVENHPGCSTPASDFPTRLIDVGIAPDDSPRLQIMRGSAGQYAALSHCWGGNIPCKMMTDNLKAYQDALPMHDLPRNFLDAIRLTREIGLRYLWIDAMCIIQDSIEDWTAEAARMASVYSNARVTISALDSPGSTHGFLVPRSHKRVNLGQGFVFSEHPLDYYQAIEGGLLNTRGWCMQEWALSKFMLYIGREQMYWECPTITAREDGIPHDAYYMAAPMGFEKARKTLSLGRPTSMRDWYTIVTEFNTRDLTFGSDKLPALAGVASRFGSSEIGGSYIAGLWTEDILTGIFWLANNADREFALGLCQPKEPRAPSWSWASIDGKIWFPWRTTPLHPSLQVLGFDVNVAMDDFAASRVEGDLKLRGLMAKMRYTPVNRREPGDAIREGLLDLDGVKFHDLAILDRDRDIQRDCWVLVLREHGADVLLLEEADEGKYRRVGCGSGSRELVLHGLDRFSLMDVTII